MILWLFIENLQKMVKEFQAGTGLNYSVFSASKDVSVSSSSAISSVSPKGIEASPLTKKPKGANNNLNKNDRNLKISPIIGISDKASAALIIGFAASTLDFIS